MSELAYIGLGSNLGERHKQLTWALAQLDAIDQINVTGCSSFYETAPVGDIPGSNISEGCIKGQQDFLNAVCQIETDLSARLLLNHLLEIEKQYGRKRTGERNAPRTLDLDLLLYGETIINTAHLSVPHPRLHNRAFVLYPLMEIAPQLAVPGKGRLEILIKEVESQEIKKLID